MTKKTKQPVPDESTLRRSKRKNGGSSGGNQPTATSSGTRLNMGTRRWGGLDAYRSEMLSDETLGETLGDRMSAIAANWKKMTPLEKAPWVTKAEAMNRRRHILP